MMAITIVTVVLDDVLGLNRTAASIMGQHAADLDWVIADGGSTDGSLELAQSLSREWSCIRVLEGPDSGIYSGMNRALLSIDEERYVWFLNAGDFLLSDRSIATAVTELGRSPWIGGPMALVQPTGGLHEVTAVPDGRPLHIRPGRSIPAQPTVIAARSMFSKYGFFREDLRLASDGILLQNFAREVPLRTYSQPLVGFVLGGRSSQNFRQTIEEYWSAGYRPRRSIDRIRDREIGQLKTWLRGTLASRWPRKVHGRLDAHGQQDIVFPHWTHHRAQAGDLSCCLSMRVAP